MKKLPIILALVLTVSYMFSKANINVEQDTTVQNALNIMQESDSIKREDSLISIRLHKELEELKSHESRKRKNLEKKLQELKEKDSLALMANSKRLDSLRKFVTPSPVIGYKDTLFYVYSVSSKETAKERASRISTTLKDVRQEYRNDEDSIYIQHDSLQSSIYFKQNKICSFTAIDEAWTSVSKEVLANKYALIIEENIVYYRNTGSVIVIMKQVGLAILVILVQYFLIKFLNNFYKNKVEAFILRKKEVWFKGIKIRTYILLDSDKLTKGVLGVSTISKYFLIAIQLYISLPILFSIFPPTRNFAEKLISYFITPLKKMGIAIIDFIPNLITIAVVFIVTRYLLKLIRYFSQEIATENLKIPGFYPDWAKPTFNIVRFLIYAFMFVVIFPYLPGSDSPVFKGVSVFIGILFSLGSSSVIGNMIAGFVITYMRPFRIGDRIKIGDTIGDVIEKTAFVTRIKTPKQEIITVPNSNILSTSVTNYSTSKEDKGVILHTTVTIGYDVPWRKVHKVLLLAAKKTMHVSEIPQPFVLQTELSDFYVAYQLNMYTKQPHLQAVIYSNLHENIQDCFNEHGIEILSPHYRAMRDGNMSTIPSDYLPPDYEAPSFTIQSKNKDTKSDDTEATGN